jgi:Uma2 family endonuclease
VGDVGQGADRGVKFEDYAAHGVGEYWLVDPENERLEQYLLEGESYQMAFKADNGTVSSRVVAGFAVYLTFTRAHARNPCHTYSMTGP